MPSAEFFDGSCSGIRRSTTRPLPIRKDGAWYAYGWHLSRNVIQPIQWSSEYNDEEFGIIYYN